MPHQDHNSPITCGTGLLPDYLKNNEVIRRKYCFYNLCWACEAENFKMLKCFNCGYDIDSTCVGAWFKIDREGNEFVYTEVDLDDERIEWRKKKEKHNLSGGVRTYIKVVERYSVINQLN